MKNKITNLKISNFKSIKDAELECGRINLFVGKPNVGKSNVLEAISLLGASYSRSDKFMSEFIRYESFANLYHFYNTDNPIVVNSNIGGIAIFNRYENKSNEFYIGPEEAIKDQLTEKSNRNTFADKHKLTDGDIKADWAEISSKGFDTNRISNSYSPVKKYSYEKNNKIDTLDRSFLMPPSGDNLFSVLQSNNKLKKEIPNLFDEYGFGFLIDLEENKFAIQRIENGISYKIPYSLIADTLQRLIFHYAAIFSNKDSVILFEEPESHSYPPYIRELALKIIEDTDNQYFITTHSSHLFTTIVEETEPEDLAVFITYFESYETKFKKLNTEDINDILNGGVNIFFNEKWFMNG